MIHRPPLAHQLQHLLLRLLQLRRVSLGKPSEKNLYADIDATWQALRTWYGVSAENIILYGQSIGTVPTVHLASGYECAAVILRSPLMPGLRVAFPNTRKT